MKRLRRIDAAAVLSGVVKFNRCKGFVEILVSGVGKRTHFRRRKIGFRRCGEIVFWLG